MALVRVTPETAVETVEQLVREFRDAVEDAGRAPAFVKLREQADDLLVLIEAVALEIEVLAIDLEPQWAAVVAQWLGFDGEKLIEVVDSDGDLRMDPKLSHAVSVVRIRRGEKATARRVGERVAPILVVAHSSTESPEDELIQEIVHEIKHRPLTLIAAPEGSDWAEALAGLGSRDAWICKFMDLPSLAQKDLEGSLTRPPWQQAGQLACGWSVAGALSAMHSAFAVALANEGRAVDSRKAALEQQASASMQLAEVASPSEVLGEVRNYIQKQFDSFSKNVTSQMDDLVAPHEGTLRLEIESGINAIDDFDYEKKPKVFAVKVPPPVQNGLINRIKETLAAVGQSDVQNVRQLLHDVRDKVESLVESRGGPPVTLHFDPIEQQVFDNILNRAIALQRPYRGELVRKGPLDFFMQARRYSMMFFMVLSAFGLSFIRQYKEITVPLTILLLMFGLLNVVNQARKQASENKEKELNKARDSLRSDLGRGMQDVMKNWGQTVSNHLSAQQAEALEVVESAVKASAAEMTREAAEKKELYNKQLKGLDNSQRKINEGVKKSEVAAKDLGMLSEQLVEFYAGMVRPPTDQPVVPGVPGAVRPAVPGIPSAAASPAVPKVPGVPGAGRPAAPAIPGAPPMAPPGGAAPPPDAAAALKKLQELQKKAPGAPSAPAAAPPSPAKPSPAAGGGTEDPAERLKQIQAEAAEKLKKAKASAGAAKAGPAAKRPASGAAAKKPAGGAAAERFEELKRKMREKKAKSPGAKKPPSRGS